MTRSASSATGPGQRLSRTAVAPELAEVGRSIRRLRQDKGLSVSALAEQAGLSQPFVSQLENGAHTPSLQTLYRVAAALGVPPGELFSAPAPVSGWIRHASSQIATSDSPHTSLATVLAPGGGGSLLEAYEWEVGTHDADEQWWQHEGEDLIYVVSGSVLVEVEGSEPIVVEARGSAHLVETFRPHRWTPLPGSPARLLLVRANPPSAGPPR